VRKKGLYYFEKKKHRTEKLPSGGLIKNVPEKGRTILPLYDKVGKDAWNFLTLKRVGPLKTPKR